LSVVVTGRMGVRPAVLVPIKWATRIQSMSNGNCKARFEEIYRLHSWSGQSRSGPGSDPANLGQYKRFVDQLLRKIGNGAKLDVIDLGCGDFSSSRCLDFDVIRQYTGVDIVEEVINANRATWGDSSRRFECLDILEEEIPRADVILIKDVLQHLSNAAIKEIVRKALSVCSHLIITNDRKKLIHEGTILGLPVWRGLRKMGVLNENIDNGGSRPLDLGGRPFSYSVIARYKFASITSIGPPAIKYIKEIVVLKGAQTVGANGAKRG
jgi:SAM-dependent methyltransferase